MRVTSKGSPGQLIHAVIIKESDPEIWVRLALIFLTPCWGPKPPLKFYARDFIFSGDERQFKEFAAHMDLEKPGWLQEATGEAEPEQCGFCGRPTILGVCKSCAMNWNDPTDRGIKTQAVHQGRAELEALLNPVLEEREHELKAAASLSPARDIDRGGAA